MKIEEGTVVAVYPERGTVKVQREESDSVISAELPVIFRGTLKNKEFSMPVLNEQVVCIFSKGSTGYVLGAIYSDVTPPPVADPAKHYFKFEDGAKFEYDTAAHVLTVLCETLQVDGNIICSGTITTGGVDNG